MQALQVIEQRWSERARMGGRREGRMEGWAEMLLRLMRLKCGSESEEIKNRIEAVTDEATFNELLRQILNSRSLVDIHVPEP